MPHQQPVRANYQNYAYSLTYEIDTLLRLLAAKEANSLHLQRLTPAQYLSRIVRQEAAQLLSDEEREQAHKIHQARTQERIEAGAYDPELPRQRKRRSKATPSAKG